MKLFLYFVLFLFSIPVFSTPYDSIGVRTKGGRSYILHKIEAGETLYALSKRYESSISSIERSNTIDGGLSVGQVVWIPSAYKIEEPIKDVKFHTVQTGQTLYAISRLYNVSVVNIKEWNKLSSNELAVGQKIIVAKGVKIEKTVQKVEVPEEIKKEEPKEVKSVKKQIIKKEAPVVKERKTSYNPQMQIGEVILGTENKLNYKFSYCLHPTAPIGTIMVLTCKVNDRVILLKVVGNTSMEEGVILKVNRSVFNSLNIDNKSFEAEVTYLD